MRRSRLLLVVLLMFVLTTALDAQFPGVWEVDFTYYSDGTFTTAVGGETDYCLDGSDSWGSTTDWRTRDRYSCRTGQLESHVCQQSDGMGGWTFISCP